MKRKSSPLAGLKPKRIQGSKASKGLANNKSIDELAEPYHLLSARLPISALSTTWSSGTNRPVDFKHVQDLCRIFKEQGLHREATGNHLRVACTQSEVQTMLAHLESTGPIAHSPKASSQYLRFDEWIQVNRKPLELMAGQHRVEALKIFLRHLGKPNTSHEIDTEQSWWICDIYDIGKHIDSTEY